MTESQEYEACRRKTAVFNRVTSICLRLWWFVGYPLFLVDLFSGGTLPNWMSLTYFILSQTTIIGISLVSIWPLRWFIPKPTAPTEERPA